LFETEPVIALFDQNNIDLVQEKEDIIICLQLWSEEFILKLFALLAE
jgi:hypothetical protein